MFPACIERTRQLLPRQVEDFTEAAALLAPGTGWITAQRIEASGGTLL
jgi:hypothetical protein